ncbi:hypothetical protein [Oligoflexus tunisiensis]|uniref:hypothetical protein n=1 Tax=Oligoflexus tunisiensis TaxID=708132 RepID=UPI00114D0595|nr:hypothetical protein [Oligoflexus tunisiensis]
MKRLVFAITGLLQLGSVTALAIPQNTRFFCEGYPASPLCVNQVTVCTTCHSQAPNLNPYGQDLRTELIKFPDFDRKPAAFQKYLRPVMLTVEPLDSDADGAGNGLEIDAGTGPGDATHKPGQDALLVFDGELALRRIGLLFCGSSPSSEELQKQREAVDPILKKQWRQDYLAQCLRSDYWKKEALQRLADDRIRPNLAIGAQGDPFVIGDYMYDYRLFAYILSEGHDARDLLLAQYHINEKGQKVEGPIASHSVPGKFVVGNGQPLQIDRRYGMLTTQWFISLNTMFAEIPRNTAAQSYRSYLGLDIAKSEGLYPIEHEPKDYDNKGVKQPACAFCHSTLDPLSYAFTPYAGISVPGYQVGTYMPDRTEYESLGYIFGQPVANLGEWARVAAESDAFKQNLALMFFQFSIGHAPRTSQQRTDFAQLWQNLDEDGYAADRLLHRLVETLTFAGRISDAE